MDLGKCRACIASILLVVCAAYLPIVANDECLTELTWHVAKAREGDSFLDEVVVDKALLGVALLLQLSEVSLIASTADKTAVIIEPINSTHEASVPGAVHVWWAIARVEVVNVNASSA